MDHETLQLLLLVTGGLFALTMLVATFYARRIALALGKATGVKVTEEQLRELDVFVAKAVAYVEEVTHRYLRGLEKSTPQSAQDKQALAVSVARELSPSSLSAFTDKQVAIAVDAAVQDRRVSIAPRAISFPPPAGKSIPPGRVS